MDVQHDPKRHRFSLEVTGGTAELVYRPVGEHTLELLHTGVPDAAAGQGVGGKLAKAAFDWARQNGMRLVPTCPFVKKWLERAPGRAGSGKRRARRPVTAGRPGALPGRGRGPCAFSFTWW